MQCEKPLRQYKEVVQSPLTLVRKAIMLRWVGDGPPHHYVNGSALFLQTWKKPLESLGVKYNLTLLDNNCGQVV